MARQLSFAATTVALAMLVVGALASANGLLYECNAARLTADNLCIFSATSSNTAGASAHNIDRNVAADGFRVVNNANGQTLSVTPQPWTQGDVLAATTTEQTGDALGYVKAFEMMAPLRDKMMYDPASLTTSATAWAAYTKALTDCSVKTTTQQVTEGTQTVTAYSTTDIYAILQNPSGQTGPSVHHSILQYLEEGAIDLVCVMTQLSMTRCDTMRTTLNIPAGGTSTCWEAAYSALYSSSSATPAPVAGAATPIPAAATPSPASSSASSLSALIAGAAAVMTALVCA